MKYQFYNVLKVKEYINKKNLKENLSRLSSKVEDFFKFRNILKNSKLTKYNGEKFLLNENIFGYKNKYRIGRLYPRFSSIIYISRENREMLLRGYYVDYDIYNCHPSLALYLGEQNGLHLPDLRFFVNNRDFFFKTIIKENNQLKKKEIKKYFLILFNGGNVDFFLKKLNFLTRKTVERIYKDFLRVVDYYYYSEKKINEVEYLISVKGKLAVKKNKKLSIFHYKLNSLESEILLSIFEEFKLKTVIPVFDGFLLRNTEYSESLIFRINIFLEKKYSKIIFLKERKL